MKRILVYLSKPQIFVLVMFLLLGLAAATWSIDQYLTWRNGEASFEQNGVRSSTAAKIVARRKLVVGIRSDVAPFGFIANDGRLQGFDVDIARELSRRWLGREDALELRIVTAADHIPKLVSQDVDLLIAAMPTRRERDALIDFSQAYFVDDLGFLVRSTSTLDSLPKMNGRTIGIIAGSSVHEVIKRETDLQDMNLQFEEFIGYSHALDALGSGTLDGITANSMTLFQLAQGNPGLKVIRTPWQPQPYGIGVHQGDSHIRAMVNFTLEDMKRDGTYDRYYQKWFVANQPTDIQISPGDWTYDLSQLSPDPLTLTNPINEIRQRGTLRAGVPNAIAPFGFRDENNEWAGFDIDIVKELARRWLGDENAIEFVPGEIVDHANRLATGEIDLIAAGMIKRREWVYTIDFSQTYLGPPVVNEPLGIGIRQNAPAFRELLNFTLQEMKQDGVYDTLHVRWFGSDRSIYSLEVWPGNADYLLVPYAQESQPVRLKGIRDSAIKRIRQRGGVLLAGVTDNVYPFGFLNEVGEVTGFDVDLLNAIAVHWGVELNLIVQPQGNQLTQLVQGQVDLIGSSVTHTKFHEAELDFSRTYFEGGHSVLVSSSDTAAALDDLSNTKLAVVGGTLTQDSIQLYLNSIGVEASIILLDSVEEAMNLLAAEAVRAVVADTIALAPYVQNHVEFTLLDTSINSESYALAIAGGDAYFQNLLDQTLFELQQSGTYETLYKKWFGSELEPKIIINNGWTYTFSDSPVGLDRPTRSKVDQLGQNPTLTVAIAANKAPFSFIDDSGQPAGLDVEIIRDFAARWLGERNAVEFLILADENYGSILSENEADLIGGALLNPLNRDEQIGSSQPYLLTDERPYMLGIPFADDKFRDLVNFTLQEMQVDGTLEKLGIQWLGQDEHASVEVWPGQHYFISDLVPMIKISSGEFVRGYRNGFPDERIEKSILLDTYYIDQYEVTNHQYDHCVRAGQCSSPKFPRSINFSQYFGQASFGNYPAIWVSWHDAASYCSFVGKRLPSEAEWEYAARGTQNNLYPWGDAQPIDQSNFDYIRSDAVPVGSFPQDRSEFGVYDLAGNVREWVADWYEWDYYPVAAEKNPKGPEVAVTKVLRGGSWNDTTVYMRSTVRRNFLPDSVDSNLGFRCASSFPPLSR
ncbi:MAG: transporter substrate-binding domain-containing protein [Chloroflexota bacterium]